jgi:hypothetical protein
MLVMKNRKNKILILNYKILFYFQNNLVPINSINKKMYFDIHVTYLLTSIYCYYLYIYQLSIISYLLFFQVYVAGKKFFFSSNSVQDYQLNQS